jgi:hypothetical protein
VIKAEACGSCGRVSVHGWKWEEKRRAAEGEGEEGGSDLAHRFKFVVLMGLMLARWRWASIAALPSGREARGKKQGGADPRKIYAGGSSRANRFRTDEGCQRPPLGVTMPRSFSSLAMAGNDVAPAARISAMTGA